MRADGKEHSVNEKECEDLLQDIRAILQNPSELSAERERQEITAYCEAWKRDKRIEKIWREGHLFFALIYGDKLFSKLKTLMNGDREAFLDGLSEIEAPFILSECLDHIWLAGDWDAAVWTLEHAPAVTRRPDDIRNLQIDSALAPVLLDVLTKHLAHTNGTTQEERTGISDGTERQIDRIIAALHDRPDGFYLAFHFVRFILEREPPGAAYDSLVDKLSETFSEKAREIFLSGGGLVMDETDRAEKQLAALGQLRRAEDPDCLITFRTIMAFLAIEGHEKTLFRAFQAVLASEASSFYTNDFKWRSKHNEIAELLLKQDNIPQAWDTLSKLLLSARQRLSQSYFGGQSAALRDRFRFLRLVSLRIMDGLWRMRSDETKSLWERFWTSGLDDARRFSQYDDDFSLQYLSRLICYYCVCFVPKGNENAEAMTRIFEEIESMPILIVMSVRLLFANGFDRSAFIHGSSGQFFSSAFERAREVARGRKQYAWVERFLSDSRFCD